VTRELKALGGFGQPILTSSGGRGGGKGTGKGKGGSSSSSSSKSGESAVVSLSDALWPDATRNAKGRTAAWRSSSPNKEENESDGGEFDAPQRWHGVDGSVTRHGALVASLDVAGAGGAADTQAGPSPSKLLLSPPAGPSLPRVVVTDQEKARGLHVPQVATVFVLGAAANSDTYLHLAGRTGRWPQREAMQQLAQADEEAEKSGGGKSANEDGGNNDNDNRDNRPSPSSSLPPPPVACRVVTVAPSDQVRRLLSWGSELGGIEFTRLGGI
jgi:hypothetical protein